MNCSYKKATQEQIDWNKKQRLEKEHKEMLEAARSKIMNGLAANNNRSGERAIWELLQNARDLSDDAVVKIKLTRDKLEFSHKGELFTQDTLTRLIKQQSSKDENDDKAGQFGTGFMTTHVFNRKVYIKGDCVVPLGPDNNMYVSLPETFCLDRSSDDKNVFMEKMDEELDIANNLIEQNGKNIPSEWTSFTYELTPNKVEKIANQLEITTKLIPFVLVFDERIKSVEIENSVRGETISYSKNERQINFKNAKYNVGVTFITVKIGDKENLQKVYSIEAYGGQDRIIIPTLPNGLDNTDIIPSNFLYFPMLGSENFGTNFIFHSSRLFPTEPRDSFLLPKDNDNLLPKYKHNEKVLIEMIDILFDYYRSNESKQNLPLDFAKVDFSYTGDDDITKAFYAMMQAKFSDEFINWKMIPTKKGFKSLNDGVRVLDPQIYSSLTEEQLQDYIPVVEKYAAQVGLLPNVDIVEWSKVVYGWKPSNKEYYISLDMICQSIKSNDEELFSFLSFLAKLNQKGKELMDKYPLMPNREGELKTACSLRNGKNITESLYMISKGLLGANLGKLVMPGFASIVSLSEYSRTDLRNEIIAKISNLRKESLSYCKPRLLEDVNLGVNIEQLIAYCSAYPDISKPSYRSELLPIICKLYGLDYKAINIPNIEDDENLYDSTFNFLLDNTMMMVSMKETSWMSNSRENYQLLLDFVSKIASTKDEDRLGKFNKYGIFPNQLGELCLAKDLKVNTSVDPELQKLYFEIMGNDLKQELVDDKFKSFYEFEDFNPQKVGSDIEEKLAANKYSDDSVLTIIRELNKGNWIEYFKIINAKKEDLFYSHGSEEDKEALYRIQMQGGERMKLMADLAESDNFEEIIQRANSLIKQEKEAERQFNFTFTIGKLIEDEIRKTISSELCCDMPNYISTEDKQYGQDIVISYKGKPVYYIECKAKWNFNEPAHMSSLQIKKAVNEAEHYALCCIDCTDSGCAISPDATQKEVMEAHNDIINHIYVHTDIGKDFQSFVLPILEEENDPNIDDDKAIRVTSNLACNIPKYKFVNGILFADFMLQLKKQLSEML